MDPSVARNAFEIFSKASMPSFRLSAWSRSGPHPVIVASTTRLGNLPFSLFRATVPRKRRAAVYGRSFRCSRIGSGLLEGFCVREGGGVGPLSALEATDSQDTLGGAPFGAWPSVSSAEGPRQTPLHQGLKKTPLGLQHAVFQTKVGRSSYHIQFSPFRIPRNKSKESKHKGGQTPDDQHATHTQEEKKNVAKV